MEPPQPSFQWVTYRNPHPIRMREILNLHPEIQKYCRPYRWTALYTLALVAGQILLSLWIARQPWWIFLPFAYIVGGTLNHALFVVIHECTHNLVFRSSLANRCLAMFANFPQFFPSSMGFFKYHMLHHSNQAEFEFDADLAGQREAEWVGTSRWRKALLLFFFGLVQGLLRPARLKKVPFYDKWLFINLFVQLTFLILFGFLFGFWPLLYFFLSTIFALGLHPMGGRWIQEHYVLSGGSQETYSYYGPLNKLCFNMGFHNEHHDFMKVPWAHLPKVKKAAPEFYDNLKSHRSWLKVLWTFIMDPGIALNNRVARAKAAH